MTAYLLIKTLVAEGIRFTLQGNRLQVRAASGSLSDHAQQAIRQHARTIKRYAAAACWPRRVPFYADATGVGIQEGSWVLLEGDVEARVLQRFADRLTVHVPGEKKARMLPPCDVVALAGEKKYGRPRDKTDETDKSPNHPRKGRFSYARA